MRIVLTVPPVKMGTENGRLWSPAPQKSSQRWFNLGRAPIRSAVVRRAKRSQQRRRLRDVLQPFTWGRNSRLRSRCNV